jgi:hypothetical protein
VGGGGGGRADQSLPQAPTWEVRGKTAQAPQLLSPAPLHLQPHCCSHSAQQLLFRALGQAAEAEPGFPVLLCDLGQVSHPQCPYLQGVQSSRGPAPQCCDCNGGLAQVVEHLPSMCKALSTNSSTTKKKGTVCALKSTSLTNYIAPILDKPTAHSWSLRSATGSPHPLSWQFFTTTLMTGIIVH